MIPLREKILQVAIQQFLSGGENAVSMRGIAKRLNITHPAIYTYFDNKEAIITAIKADSFQKLKEKMFLGINPHDDYQQSTHTVAYNFLDFIDSSPELFKLLFFSASQSDRSTYQYKIVEYIDQILNAPGDESNIPQIFWYSLIGHSYAFYTGEITKRRKYELVSELIGKLT